MKMNKLLVSLSLCMFLGCSTETGNPGVLNSEQNFSIESPIDSMASTLVGTLCEKIVSCFPDANYKMCGSALFVDVNMVPTLGLENSKYPDLISVFDDEVRGNLKVKSSGYLCLNQVNKLKCSDELLDRALQGEKDNPYDSAYETVPLVCLGSFSE